MLHKVISLTTKEQLNIFMSPRRQQLLRIMSIEGKPMTAKAVAEKLGVSASSATLHIEKLMGLGIIKQHHTEMINGITAKYFVMADVTVNIGQQFSDSLSGERGAVVQNMIMNTLNGLNGEIIRAKKEGIPQDELKDHGDFLHGVVHLKPEDSRELLKLIRDFIEKHGVGEEGTEPWEYALILYNARNVL